MRVSRGLLGWGLFLVLLGAIPLAVRLGSVSAASVTGWWQAWPLLLVGAGLGLVLARTRVAIVGGVVVSITAGCIGGSLLAGGWTWPSGGWTSPFGSCGVGDGGTAFAGQAGAFDGDATVALTMSCGDLTVGTGPGTGWSVAGTDASGRGPQVDASPVRLSIDSSARPGPGLSGAGDRWQVMLPTEPLLSVSVAVNAGSARVDLVGAHLTTLGATVNAGDLHLDLSGAATVGPIAVAANAGSLSISLPGRSVSGSIDANAGSIEVCVPAGTAIRFRLTDNPLGSNNFAQRGLARAGSDWTTPGFETATTRIDLGASANLGSITLNPENGCA